MSRSVIFGVVAAQVSMFQILSVPFAGAVRRWLLGDHDLPGTAPPGIRDTAGRTARFRIVTGVALLLVAAAVGALQTSEGFAKLALAAVSLVSSALFVAGLVHDRIMLGRLVDALPEPPSRSAVLERRSIESYYPLIWETVPPILALLTIAATAWAAARGNGAVALVRLWTPPAVLAAWVVATRLLARSSARRGAGLPQRSRARLGSPEAAARAARALERVDLRCFLAARMVVALMIGLYQIDPVATALGRASWAIFPAASWALVAVMLLVFAVFMVIVSRLERAAGRGGDW